MYCFQPYGTQLMQISDILWVSFWEGTDCQIIEKQPLISGSWSLSCDLEVELLHLCFYNIYLLCVQYQLKSKSSSINSYKMLALYVISTCKSGSTRIDLLFIVSLYNLYCIHFNQYLQFLSLQWESYLGSHWAYSVLFIGYCALILSLLYSCEFLCPGKCVYICVHSI